MKTTYKISTLIVSLALMFAINLNASSLIPAFDEESYINDIPFSTELIYEQLNMPEFNFEEEVYINDIPMDMLCVTVDCKYEQAISVDFDQEEEMYVDDMPFDTEKIANKLLIDSARNLEFTMDEEAYIDDIPFSTSLVALQKTSGNQKEFFTAGK